MKTQLSIAIYSLAFLLTGISFSAGAQCTDWLNPTSSTGWTNFNTQFGGAPCDDGTGCPFNEITGFEVYAAEAYAVDNFQAGGSYAFSICNGAGAGTWVPDFTIIAPSGAVDAFGPGDGDGCTISWTASETGTYLIVINEAGACGGGANTETDNGFPALTCTSSPIVLCDPPVTVCVIDTLSTADSVIVCNGDIFEVATAGNDTIPTGGGFGWSFSDVLGGTGGAAGGFTLTGAPNPNTYDADLNGILSANGLDPLSGLWVITGVIYTDAGDPINTVCAVTEDSLIINVLSLDGPQIDDVVDNGDGSATASASGGMAPLTFAWSDGQMGATATGLTDGEYEVTVTDANGCTDAASITVGLGEPCLDWLAPAPPNGYTNFNSAFGGAPCDDGTGCPFNEITSFEVYAAEAYEADNFQAGGTYSFSICNGPGAGSWVPEFTIIAPSGAVDAFGPGDGDGCTITWTASEDGTYVIVINEAGACGGGDNTATDNGFPALTCVSGDAVLCGDPPMTTCSVGELVTSGITSVCGPDDTFDLATDETDTIPVGGGFGWSFDPSLGGTGGLPNGFNLTNSNNVSNFDSDLNGVLSNNSLDLLGGVWVIRAIVYSDATSASGSICATSTDSLIVQFGNVPTIEVVDNNDGSATASASGGVPPYSYTWDDGQMGNMATGLEPGMHTVTATDAIGCSAEGTIDIMVGVGQIEGLESLYIGPNPTQGLFNLRLSLNNPEDIQVELINLTGQKLQVMRETQTATLSRTLDLSAQPDGVYLLRLIAGDGEISRRIVKGR
ncbi:MAG: T9SS type A sorting domain-containing protein [Lewinellaceae bacterium]|nr:T9SS type A sorting domain-containing protein [Phaeodactylibacter sp.]MCB9041628.1 T9SS type A sorting domain-containing protein [Lewinellaceae bacterium]